MMHLPLGNSGVVVSRIGLGTVKLGRTAGLRYPVGQALQQLPSDDQVVALLSRARDLGVSLLDTAPAYGTAEARLGELLPRVAPRESWVLCTKVGERFDGERSSYDFSPGAVAHSIGESLERLRVRHIDLLLLHGSGSIDDSAMLAPATIDALHNAKARGQTRAVGASLSLSRPLDPARLAELDVIMVTLNDDERDALPTIDAARARGVGVLIKKPLASGRSQPGSLGRVLAYPGVHAAVVGTANPAHLALAVAAIQPRND